MKVLSLFSGVGGFDMGLENAGMETVFQCEWDKHANSILHRHWPDVPKWDDVSTLTGKHILAHAPVVDVVAWGSPCQDLSVAGKRAGLEGGRSGLFHEGIRIIKELQEESNGQYPRISIWENVVGALNSNRGADFGVILNEMAQAGALVIEWAVLDAQYFGVPQRRRRVFVIAIFDPVLASRCPSPLLPVAESLPGHLAKGKPKKQSATSETAASFGTDGAWWDGRDTAEALTTTSNEQRMPDKQRFQAVVEGFTPSSFANYTEGVGTLRSNGGDLGGGSETLVTEPMLLDIQRVGDIRVYSEPVQSLQARMGTGGNSTPMLAFDTQFGSNANVTEDVAPTLKALQQSPIVAYPIHPQATSSAGNSRTNQDGRGNGLGIGQDGDPSTSVVGGTPPLVAHTVAYPIDTRNALRDPEKYDAQNRQGLGIGNDGDPMATLTSAYVNGVAVQYDGYNQRVNETDVSLTIRIGRDSSDFIAQPTEPILSPTLTAYNMDSRSPQSEEQQRIVNAVFESTMAVRRLTPLECERLMGWPDNHTLNKADGTTQADTHRYKQCGNGVASPVAQWIAKHLLNI